MLILSLLQGGIAILPRILRLAALSSVIIIAHF